MKTSSQGKTGLIAERLLLLYLFLSPFNRVFNLPWVEFKIQPTEFLFLLLFPVWHAAFRWKWTPPRLLALPIGIYLFINLISAAHSRQISAVLEALGRVYLVVLFGIIVAYIREKKEEGLEKAARAWLYGSLLTALLSLLGYAAASLGYENASVRFYENYPYLGDAIRAAGFTGSPKMLFFVLLFPTLYAWLKGRRGEISWLVFSILIFALTLTLAKELLIFALGLVLIDPKSQHWPRSWKIGLSISFALIFWLGTHYVILFQQPIEKSYLADANYTSQEVILEIKGLQVVETSYIAIKKANWIMGLRHFWLGVGQGESGKYLPEMQEEGVYPSHLPAYDPHSSWMGAFSETGFLGFLSLLLLIGSFAWSFNLLSEKSQYQPVTLSALIFLLVILICSAGFDAMNLRPLWIALGLTAGQLTVNGK